MSERPPLPTIPDTQLIRLIGSGTFGQVWLARNQQTQQLQALKLVPIASDNRAHRELMALRHYTQRIRDGNDHVARIYHVGSNDATLYYTMELADDAGDQHADDHAGYESATLAHRRCRGPLPPELCLRYTEELLTGLTYLHQKKLVHRDVKPANCIFVDGRLKLADIGLIAAADMTVTQIGTPRYMPPDGAMDTSADVYAAGLVIYEMMTGLPAESFPRLNFNEPNRWRDRRIQQLNRVVLRACEPDRRKRFNDAQEMLAALRQRHIHPTRRPLIVVSAASLLFAGALVTYVAVTTPHDAAEPRVEINLITQPFGAQILVDGVTLVDAAGRPFTTPCTAGELTARPHRVEFKFPDGSRVDAGTVDFAVSREISVQH